MSDDPPAGPGLAPGWPGIEPRWTSAAKSGVGTAANGDSRIWFTLSHGIVDEVYYPRIDMASTRDFGLMVAADGFFSEEKRDAVPEVALVAPAVPAYRLTNTCRQGRYRIHKTVVADPRRDVLLQRVRFEPLRGALGDYRVFALLAPHIRNHGAGNTGWLGDYKGVPMLFAERDGTALALVASVPFAATSVGYAGFSDGWQDVSRDGELRRHYPRAANGNIALTAQLDLARAGGECTLALGFGSTPEEAAEAARASLNDDFDAVLGDYVAGWRAFHASCTPLPPVVRDGIDLAALSTTVLQVHAAKHPAGALVASLSIPWGFSKGDDDLGGYHLAWPRDLAESAMAFLAAGHAEAARRSLVYLLSVQEADGHWAQNMWLDGTPYWPGVQMDETAFPILLADALRRADALDGLDPWPAVRAAAGFLVRNGPVTQEDRWEEDGGYSPFTLAVEIAALLAAAEFADAAGASAEAGFLRDTADTWNAMVERWTYVTDTELARRVGVDGYYVRIAPPEVADAPSPAGGFVPIKNRPPGMADYPAAEIVSPDALALVRFGLRAPDDPRIVATVRVIDALLRVELATGPAWHRYNEDGYGEHPDGSPFDGSGVGRAWPLLTGERAHYELALGNRAEAERLLAVMAAQSGPGGLLPEQIWDAADIPERELVNGRPSGSAMPLVWAHAELLKLARSLRDGAVFDTPPQPYDRYVRHRLGAPCMTWRFNQKARAVPADLPLRIEALAPASVHWSADGWATTQDIATTDTGLGVHIADLPTRGLPAGTRVTFTFFWPDANRWEGVDFDVTLTA